MTHESTVAGLKTVAWPARDLQNCQQVLAENGHTSAYTDDIARRETTSVRLEPTVWNRHSLLMALRTNPCWFAAIRGR